MIITRIITHLITYQLRMWGRIARALHPESNRLRYFYVSSTRLCFVYMYHYAAEDLLLLPIFLIIPLAIALIRIVLFLYGICV